MKGGYLEYKNGTWVIHYPKKTPKYEYSEAEKEAVILLIPGGVDLKPFWEEFNVDDEGYNDFSIGKWISIKDHLKKAINLRKEEAKKYDVNPDQHKGTDYSEGYKSNGIKLTPRDISHLDYYFLLTAAVDKIEEKIQDLIRKEKEKGEKEKGEEKRKSSVYDVFNASDNEDDDDDDEDEDDEDNKHASKQSNQGKSKKQRQRQKAKHKKTEKQKKAAVKNQTRKHTSPAPSPPRVSVPIPSPPRVSPRRSARLAKSIPNGPADSKDPFYSIPSAPRRSARLANQYNIAPIPPFNYPLLTADGENYVRRNEPEPNQSVPRRSARLANQYNIAPIPPFNGKPYVRRKTISKPKLKRQKTESPPRKTKRKRTRSY